MALSVVDQARDALFLDTARDVDLTRLGGIFGVTRPKFSKADSILRKLIPLLGMSEKMTNKVVSGVIDAFYGPDSGVTFYEPEANLIVVVVPKALDPVGTLSTATYLQRDPNPPSTTVTADAAEDDVSLTVASTAALVPGPLLLDDGPNQESVLIQSIVDPTTLALDPTTPLKYPHLSTVWARQYIVEPDTTSYEGDYFGVPEKTGTLSGAEAPGATSATLVAGHNLPHVGVMWFDHATPGLREKFDVRVSGTSLSLIQYPNHTPALVTAFANAHAAASSVTFFDELSAPNKASTELTDDNPVTLFADARIPDLLATLNLITASGVVVEIERNG